jgi:hypothetical protein
VNALIAELVSVFCAKLGLPPAITQTLLGLALQAAALFPAAQVEAALVAAAKAGAHWLITRPPGPDSTAPDLGGNVPADHPPIELDQPLGDSDPLP